ncbi:uncharacterized protein LOC129946222 [Eupeodes corollae]|uniref:uncharacterized protein LOC129946222 n=1 Tax=Eupeodes corollae TaxID=290404 RepID=UPI0024911282|nr:uncharacterized protein LOC129946222 [Eupeodes corollae]
MKNFYEHIKYKYDRQVCDNMKQYSNSQRKLASHKQSLKFLLICRQSGLIPNHINNSSKSTQQLFSSKESYHIYDKIQLKFHMKVLNLEISEMHHKLKRIQNSLRFHDQRIKENLSPHEYKQFTTKQKQVFQDIYNSKQQTNIHKIDDLKSALWKKFNIVFHEKWFDNRTTIKFPLEIKWLLSLGKKFALPIDKKTFPLFQLIADGEEVIREVKDEKEQELIRAQYGNMLHSFQRSQNSDQFAKYVLYVNKQAISFLKRNKNIIILSADKGNVTVAMERNEYDDKMSVLLSDRSTYWRVRHNPTTTLQNRNNELVKWLNNNNHIDDKEKNKMTTYTAQLPSIYGLPKTHKPSMPMRPIVSSLNLPCYELSRFVGRILQSVTNETKYTVKNSYEFVDKARNVKLQSNDVLVSFDVISLFTNIPVQLAINIIKKKWDTISRHTKISQTKFIEIMDFCLKDNNYLQFKDIIYKQIFGMPMGNPIRGPTASGRLINFRSNQAKHIIFNTASNLINKVFTLSDVRFHHSNTIKVTKILSDNGFPPAIIRGLILQQQCRRAKQQSEDNNKGYFKSIVYVPKLAESFKQVVTKNIQDVRLAFKSNQTIRHLFTKLKTKIDRDKRTDVIYKINCKGKPDETCNLCYIGTTKQFLRQRLSNHKSDIKNNNLAKTALAAHSIDKGHSPDFDCVKLSIFDFKI